MSDTVVEETSGQGYPQPPWHTHGRAVFGAYRVPVSSIDLPRGVEPISVLGHCAGILAFVRYTHPSPLCYDELIWMPSLVETRTAEGRRLRGYHVAVMVVDDATSLAAGRREWALPKQLGTFEHSARRIDVRAADGTHAAIRSVRIGPRAPRARASMATLQVDGADLVRFKATTRGHARAGSLRLLHLDSPAPAWESLRAAKPVPWGGAALEAFETTMHPATLHRRPDHP